MNETELRQICPWFTLVRHLSRVDVAHGAMSNEAFWRLINRRRSLGKHSVAEEKVVEVVSVLPASYSL